MLVLLSQWRFTHCPPDAKALKTNSVHCKAGSPYSLGTRPQYPMSCLPDHGREKRTKEPSYYSCPVVTYHFLYWAMAMITAKPGQSHHILLAYPPQPISLTKSPHYPLPGLPGLSGYSDSMLTMSMTRGGSPSLSSIVKSVAWSVLWAGWTTLGEVGMCGMSVPFSVERVV